MPRPSVLGELLQEVGQAQTDPKVAAQAHGLPTLEQSYPREGVTPVYPEEWLMPGKAGFKKLSRLALGSLAFPDLLSRFMWQATKRRVPPEFQRIIRAIEADPRQLAVRALARPDEQLMESGLGSSLGKYFWPEERLRRAGASPEEIQAFLQKVRVRPQAVVDVPRTLSKRRNPFGVLAHEVVGHGGQEFAGKFDVAFPGLTALQPEKMRFAYPTRRELARELLPMHVEQSVDPLRHPMAFHIKQEDPGAFTRALREWWPE